MKTRITLISVAALVCVGLLFVLAESRRPAAKTVNTWPLRPVRIIVPLPPGSGPDLTARLFAERLAERWGQPVLVENRAGADGIVGVSAFLAAEPSETLLFSSTAPYVLNALTHKSLPYDPQRDLVPLSAGAEVTGTITLSATLSATSLKEIVALARERRGQIFWTATPGFAEMGFSAFLKNEHLEMTFVPYKDVATPLQDLAQGRLHLMVTALATVQPQVTAGKARLLAVQTAIRSSAAPDAPTVTELGYPGLSFDGVSGFYGRRELSVALREKISADVQSVGKNPELVARLAAMGQKVSVGTPEVFSARLERQRSAAAQVAATLELKPQ
jgi:tripartite-type tricarboxylate transporter receptor subunit TctC